MNLYSTSIYGTMGIASQLEDIATFIINNRNSRIPIHEISEILRTKVFSDTPVTNIFMNALKNSAIDNLFTAINVINSVSIPEAVTAPYITLDTLQLAQYNKKAYAALSALPEFRDRIIVNLTHLLKTKPPVSVSDINELHSLYVRGLLIRSYYNSKNWLSPEMIKYFGKSYSMTISLTISRSYGLTYNEQLVIATILTAYFHQLCYDVGPNEWSPSIIGCDYLGDRMTIGSTLEQLKEHLDGRTNMTILDIIDLIKKTGPSRLESLNTHQFYRFIQSLGTTGIYAMIAVEYPPYWVHQILLSFSGVKSGLGASIQRNRQLLSEGKAVVDLLNRSSHFIPSL